MGLLGLFHLRMVLHVCALEHFLWSFNLQLWINSTKRKNFRFIHLWSIPCVFNHNYYAYHNLLQYEKLVRVVCRTFHGINFDFFSRYPPLRLRPKCSNVHGYIQFCSESWLLLVNCASQCDLMHNSTLFLYKILRAYLEARVLCS